MTYDEKLLHLFELVHGVTGGSCYLEIEHEDSIPTAVNMMKNGQVCWSATREELVFQYVTRDL